MYLNSPNQILVMRTAAWMWILYLASLATVDMVIYANQSLSPVIWYHFINIIPALAFLGLSYTPWLKNYDRVISFLMILLISVVPVLVNHLLGLRLPPAPLSNLEGMVLRQLPVLFIGLVLVAWHYDLVIMLLYTLATNGFELALVFAVNRMQDERMVSLYFIIIIRTVCFFVVGIFINQLIHILRTQQASLKLANDQLTHYSSTLESLTISRERNRMARELHDTVAHTLTGLSVTLETARAYFDIEPEKTREMITKSLASTRAGIDETRRALKSLRASPLDDLGLLFALKQMAESAAARFHLNLSLHLPDPIPALSPEVEQCIYRVAQEAVENICHHANARNLCMDLTILSKACTLTIEDDGIGFDANRAVDPGHFGLVGMKERAQAIGGKLDIHSQPGRGTRINLTIQDKN